MIEPADEPASRTGTGSDAQRAPTLQIAVDVLERMSDAFVAIDREWRFNYVNRAAERASGLPREEILGRTLWEVFPDRTREFESACRRAMDAEVTVHSEEYYVPLDTWFDTSVYPSTGGITVYARDVTERKRAQEALREQERVIHQMAAFTPIVLKVFDLATERDAYIRFDVLTLLGYTPSKIDQIDETISMVRHPEESTAATECLAHANRMADGEISEVEFRVRRRDGEWRWLASRSTPFVRDKQGEVREVLTATLDITDRKRAEEGLCRANAELEPQEADRMEELTALNAQLKNECAARVRVQEELRRANEKIAEILESIRDGFCAWDKNWRYIYVNKAAEQILGKPRHQLIAKCVWDVFPEVIGTEVYRKCQEAMAERVSLNFEVFFPVLDRWYENYVYPTNEGLSIYWCDITDRKRTEQELRESHRRTENILESITDAFYAMDREWRYTYINERAFRLIQRPKGKELTRDGLLGNIDAIIGTDQRFVLTAWNKGAEEMYGWRADEVLGRNVLDVVPSDRGDEQRVKAQRQLMETGALRAEERTYRKDGTPVEVESRSIALQGAQNQITGYVTIVRDITERKRAEEERRRSEAYLAEGQKMSHTGSWAWNVSTGALFWSLEHFHICGVDPDTFKPTLETARQLIHPEDRIFANQAFERAIDEQVEFESELRIVRPDGTIRYVHSLAHPVFNDSGDVTEYIGTIMDITERQKEEEMRTELRRRLTNAQEDERRRLSRELHDQLGQQVSALKWGLDALRRERTDQHLDDELASLQTIASQLDSDVDFIAWQLRPTGLDDLDLAAALQHYVVSWAGRFGIHAQLHVSGIDPNRVTDEIQTALYRILQEALNNVAKHSRATHVQILLEGRSDRVSLIVEDDGRGFDTAAAFVDGAKPLGLVGMRERAALLGGTLDVESPGRGTRVVARIPAPVRSNGKNGP
jgi:PAS domain S-box-containing protein